MSSREADFNHHLVKPVELEQQEKIIGVQATS